MGYLHALVLVMVMAAAAASFVSRQVLGLVHDVTREQSRRARLGRYFSPAGGPAHRRAGRLRRTEASTAR